MVSSSIWFLAAPCSRLALCRINVAGLHIVSYLARLLQLRYPALQTHITLTRAQELVNAHGYLALEYAAELRAWAEGQKDKDVRVIQLPYTQVCLEWCGCWSRDQTVGVSLSRRLPCRWQLIHI